MGRDKNASRVKGNMKPSSSSRAAELLRSNASAPVFLGFSSASNSTEHQLEGELSVIVKKLEKRDAITKRKAAEELYTFLNANKDEVFNILPYWAPVYNKHSVDADRRLRFAINQAHSCIVQIANKKLAPYLKEIMGAWLNSMFDYNNEVASVAVNAFNATFSESKRKEVMKFCLSDIQQFVFDNLVIRRPETMSDPRFSNPEEMAAKYSRVISGCFMTFHYLLDLFDTKECSDGIYRELQKPLEHERVWELVKAQVYIILNDDKILLKAFADNYIDNMQKLFFQRAFKEVETMTHKILWDAILLLCKNYPNVWEGVDKKSIVNDFMTFIKNGAYGSASISFPCVVVFVSMIPLDLRQGLEFAERLKQSFWLGFESEHIDKIRSDSWLNSMFECQFYLSASGDKNELFQLFFVPILDLFLNVDKSRSLQEKINDWKFAEILSQAIWKIYRNSFFSNEFLNSQVLLQIEDFLFQKHCKPETSKRIGLLAQNLASGKDGDLFAKWLSKMYSKAFSTISDGNYLHFLRLTSASVSDDLNQDFLSNFLSNVLEWKTSSADEKIQIAKIAYNISKNSGSLEEWAHFWTTIIIKSSRKDSIELLGCFLKEVYLDPKNSTIGEIREFEEFLLSIYDDSVNFCFLLKQALHFEQLISLDFLNKLVDFISNEFGGDENHERSWAFWDLLEYDMGKSKKLLVKSNNGAVLVYKGIQFMSIEVSLGNIDTAAVQKRLANVDSKLLKGVLAEHRNQLITNDFLDSEEVAILLDILWSISPKWSSMLFPPESDMFTIIDQSLSIIPDLNLIQPLIDINHPSISAYQYVLGRDGVSVATRFLAAHVKFYKKVGFETVADDLKKLEIEAVDLHFMFLISIVLVVRISLDLGNETMFASDQKNLVLSACNDLTTLIEGLIVSSGTNFQSMLQSIISETSTNLIERILINFSNHLKFKQFSKLAITYVFECGVAINPDPTSFNLDQFLQFVNAGTPPEWIESVIYVLFRASKDLITYSQKLKIVNSLLKYPKRIPKFLPIVLHGNVGHLFDIHLIEESPIPLLNAEEIIEDYLQVLDEDFRALRVISSLLRFPSAFQAHHWLLIFPRVTRGILETKTEMEKLLCLMIACRLFAIKEYSDKFSDNFSSLFDQFELGVSLRLFKDFTSLDQCPYQGSLRKLWEVVISLLIERIPVGVIRREWSFDQLLIPLGMQNQEIQKASYRLLHDLTVELVTELSNAIALIGLEKDQPRPLLPQALLKELVAIRNDSLSPDYIKHSTLKYLLSAMILLDHLEYANFLLKSAYIEHLQQENTLDYLLKSIFDIVGLCAVGRKPFDLTKWDVEYFDILSFDLQSSKSSQLLASQIYWRILRFIPSEARKWFSDLKNRQLSVAVETFTEKFFSSAIAAFETENLREADFGDTMLVKVIRGTVSNEVLASYTVDDCNLEIAILMPNCYPLKVVEVEGRTRVGVSEERWRRWLLNCNVMMSAQNGSIKDALMIWKQNVDRHFEGVEDCAICYSVVGVLDRSLPTKQCRTCKKKFHGACLYKWFKTSNNSSCPLCRALF